MVSPHLDAIDVDDAAEQEPNAQNQSCDLLHRVNGEGLLVELDLVGGEREGSPTCLSPSLRVRIEPLGRKQAHLVEPGFEAVDRVAVEGIHGGNLQIRVKARLQNQLLLRIRYHRIEKEIGAWLPVRC